ncbi:hypothetical protein RB195_015563 [Necator americanus]|uniref:Syntaxin N-terminal domain-containing protein n=1 Tax=Necator americanus TaxID=51031 RepID=A0ABR1E725_NECAM
MEKISVVAQGLSLTYNLYALLVMADNKLANSRNDFFNDTEDGVTLEPSFTADFVRREIEFIKKFRRQVKTEIREAELQEQRENHIGVFVQVKDAIEDLHREFKQYYVEIKGHSRSQSESIHSIKEELRRDFKQCLTEINKRITNQSENINCMREDLHQDKGRSTPPDQAIL